MFSGASTGGHMGGWQEARWVRQRPLPGAAGRAGLKGELPQAAPRALEGQASC